MARVYARGETLYLDYFDGEGKRCQPATPYRIGQEKLARETLDLILAKVAEEKEALSRSGKSREMTVLRYYEEKYAPRRQQLSTCEEEESRFRHHA